MPARLGLMRVEVHQIRVGLSWMDSIVMFLKDGALPNDKGEVEKTRRKVHRFWLSEEQKLYKCFFSGPYLLCVHPKAMGLLLEELHEGNNGSHIGGKSLSHKALTQGYWWANMQKEAQNYVRKCDQYQRFSLSIYQPGGMLNPLSSL